MKQKHSIFESFAFAFDGLGEVFSREPNFKIHIIIATAALILAWILKLSGVEWLILLFTIASVLILELINTAIEELVDIISPETNEKAKVIKDVSAASVLIAAVVSIIIGLVLFLPKIISLLGLTV